MTSYKHGGIGNEYGVDWFPVIPGSSKKKKKTRKKSIWAFNF